MLITNKRIVRVKLLYQRIRRLQAHPSMQSCRCRRLPNLAMSLNWNIKLSGICRRRIIGARRGPLIILNVIVVHEETRKRYKTLDRAIHNSRHKSCYSNNFREKRRFCIPPKTQMPVDKTSTILILLRQLKKLKLRIKPQCSILRRLRPIRENHSKQPTQLR